MSRAARAALSLTGFEAPPSGRCWSRATRDLGPPARQPRRIARRLDAFGHDLVQRKDDLSMIGNDEYGSICAAVLHTRDLESSAAFYRSMMGWTIEPAGETSDHLFVRHHGSVVAHLQRTASDIGAWVPHVAVPSLEPALSKATSLGAMLVATTHVSGIARMAVLRDLEGALIGLWEPAPHRGAERMDDTGSLWWAEVLSNDVTVPRAFYSQLFGWAYHDTSFEPFERYTVFTRGEGQEAGILPIGPDWGVSPLWNCIFAVDDCDVQIERAVALGGSTRFVHTVPLHGRVGSICDPGGAVFVMRGPTPSAVA